MKSSYYAKIQEENLNIRAITWTQPIGTWIHLAVWCTDTHTMNLSYTIECSYAHICWIWVSLWYPMYAFWFHHYKRSDVLNCIYMDAVSYSLLYFIIFFSLIIFDCYFTSDNVFFRPVDVLHLRKFQFDGYYDLMKWFMMLMNF